MLACALPRTRLIRPRSSVLGRCGTGFGPSGRFGKDRNSQCGTVARARTRFTKVVAHLSCCINRILGGLGRGKLSRGALIVFSDSGNPRRRNKTSPAFFNESKGLHKLGHRYRRKKVHVPFVTH